MSKSGRVVRTGNPSIWNIEARESGFQDQPCLHTELEEIL